VAYTDAHALNAMTLNGVIHEDVMDKIHDISNTPLPFTSRIGSTSHTNQHFEWRVDRLAAGVDTNAILDGAESKADESVQTGQEFRVGNYSQISTKALSVSSRAQAVSTIGYAKSLAYQVMMRGQELRRDVEVRSMANKPNVLDLGFGSGTPGQTAGLECWCDDENVLNDSQINATHGNPSAIRDMSDGVTSHGGWTNRSGEILAATNYGNMATPAALTEEAIKDVVEQLYMNGADPTILMARPGIIRKISEFNFSTSARVATLTNQDGAASHAQRIAQGSVNIMVTDFCVLELVPNRHQKVSGDTSPDCDVAFIFDPTGISISYLQGYRTIPLAVDGLVEKRLISVDWGLRVGNWEGLGLITGILASAAMTAS